MYNPDQPRDAQGEWTDTGAGEHFPKGPAPATQIQIFPELRRPGAITHQSRVLQDNIDRAEHTARMQSNGTITPTHAARQIDTAIADTKHMTVDPNVEGQKKAVLDRMQQLRTQTGEPNPLPTNPARLIHPGHTPQRR